MASGPLRGCSPTLERVSAWLGSVPLCLAHIMGLTCLCWPWKTPFLPQRTARTVDRMGQLIPSALLTSCSSLRTRPGEATPTVDMAPAVFKASPVRCRFHAAAVMFSSLPTATDAGQLLVSLFCGQGNRLRKFNWFARVSGPVIII